jgi:hypothetical protein
MPCLTWPATSTTTLPHQAHDEEIPLLDKGIYTMRGYAYCGGGRRVHRVELSLDDGQVGVLVLSFYLYMVVIARHIVTIACVPVPRGLTPTRAHTDVGAGRAELRGVPHRARPLLVLAPLVLRGGRAAPRELQGRRLPRLGQLAEHAAPGPDLERAWE